MAGPDSRRARTAADRATEHAHRGCGLQAVADDVADRDAEAVFGPVHHVVPVAADVEALGGGQVAHCDVVVPGQVRCLHHRFLKGDSDLPFPGVGLPQLLVQFLQLLRPDVEFRLHGRLARPGAAGVGEHELGDVFHPVQDPGHLPVRPAHGDVDGGCPPSSNCPPLPGTGMSYFCTTSVSGWPERRTRYRDSRKARTPSASGSAGFSGKASKRYRSPGLARDGSRRGSTPR